MPIADFVVSSEVEEAGNDGWSTACMCTDHLGLRPSDEKPRTTITRPAAARAGFLGCGSRRAYIMRRIVLGSFLGRLSFVTQAGADSDVDCCYPARAYRQVWICLPCSAAGDGHVHTMPSRSGSAICIRSRAQADVQQSVRCASYSLVHGASGLRVRSKTIVLRPSLIQHMVNVNV